MQSYWIILASKVSMAKLIKNYQYFLKLNELYIVGTRSTIRRYLASDDYKCILSKEIATYREQIVV